MQNGSPMVALLAVFVCLVAVWIAWLGQARRKQAQASGQMGQDGSWESDARDLALRGEKIAAIKRVREGTGLGLADAKTVVESWGLPVAAPMQGFNVTRGSEAEARELALRGETIMAVKMVRESTGLGLKEALDLVKSWQGNQPGVG